MAERQGEVTFKGEPMTLVGHRLQVGEEAPEFTLKAPDLSDVHFKDSHGKVRILSVVPSLDTSVCNLQSRRFDEEVAKLGDDVEVYAVSADLPFAQKRWAGDAGVSRIRCLSDYFDMSFGAAWGTLIKELRLEARAVFVADRNGKLVYVEYVPEVTDHPSYEAALEAAKEAL